MWDDELEGEGDADFEVDDDGDADESPLQVVGVTPEASEQIAGKGGTLYLWQKPFAGSWVTDKASFKRPPGNLEFRSIYVADIQVLVAEDIELPEKLLIRRSLWRPLKLRIEWDGRVWGWRGEGAGAGG
jgi:hypothetical protein